MKLLIKEWSFKGDCENKDNIYPNMSRYSNERNMTAQNESQYTIHKLKVQISQI